MTSPEIVRHDDRRMTLLRDAEDRHGILFIEVAVRPPLLARKRLTVHFVPKTTAAGRAHLAKTLADIASAFRAGLATVQLEAPEGHISPQILNVREDGPLLVVDLERAGDFGEYALILHEAQPEAGGLDRLDAVYREKTFSFFPECAADRCIAEEPCAPARPAEPFIDVYARDAAGFRQLMRDRLAVILPSANETNPADPLVTLLELFAWEGDRLSYRQDAVATEAYLATARHRISVRRHARLVGYEMHDGMSARVWVHVTLHEQEGAPPLGPVLLPRGTHFYPTFDRPIRGSPPPHPTVFDDAVRDATEGPETTADALVFHALDDAVLDPRLNRLRLYGWGSEDFCLPAGTRFVDLEGDLVGVLAETRTRGAWGPLLLDPVCEVDSGTLLEGDIRRRVVLRVVDVSLVHDNGVPVTRVVLHADDALGQPVAVRTILPGSSQSVELTVARGNLTLAEHGRLVADTFSSLAAQTQRAITLRTTQGPLSYGPGGKVWDALDSFLDVPDPTEASARNAVARMSIAVERRGSAEPEQWAARRTLFDADPGDLAAAVEVDDEGRARIRFGDGDYGARLPVDTARVVVNYRTGVGTAGHIGADSLCHMLLPSPGLPQRHPGSGEWPPVTRTWSELVDRITNPMAAWGGVAPEPTAQVKLRAPAAFGSQRDRAITLEDVAQVAQEVTGVARASATFRFTGSFRTVVIAVDPASQVELTEALRASVMSHVLPRLALGYDLEVIAPVYVPVEVDLTVCLRPDALAREVEVALRRELGSGSFRGKKGFFHPDSFSFGDPVRASAIEARAAEVRGVLSAKVSRLSRRNEAQTRVMEGAVLAMGAHEIARLDDDRSRRERGILRIFVSGGLGAAASARGGT